MVQLYMHTVYIHMYIYTVSIYMCTHINVYVYFSLWTFFLSATVQSLLRVSSVTGHVCGSPLSVDLGLKTTHAA